MKTACSNVASLLVIRQLPLLCLLLLSACVTAPVQEMSDARQAIRSAEEAGAEQLSPDALYAARRALQKAREWLDQGAFNNARRHALDARNRAIEAREKALTDPDPP
ncbi:MAG: DUF4398 domain-containing protein [Candidatus Competibacterales bacterium]|nr:DUF4398 domain-containing protein [Candidatus Competibacterales bacterium]